MRSAEKKARSDSSSLDSRRSKLTPCLIPHRIFVVRLLLLVKPRIVVLLLNCARVPLRRWILNLFLRVANLIHMLIPVLSDETLFLCRTLDAFVMSHPTMLNNMNPREMSQSYPAQLHILATKVGKRTF